MNDDHNNLDAANNEESWKLNEIQHWMNVTFSLEES